MTDRETPDKIADDAARWIWRLDREGRTPELLLELDSWLEGSSRRQGAFLQAEAVWQMLDAASESAMLSDQANEFVSGDELVSDGFWGRLHLNRAKMAVGLAVAASLALLAFYGPVREMLWVGEVADVENYTTSVGEVRSVPLADGSIATVNTNSAVKVSLTSKQRSVSLGRGEAWFQVAKDLDRPFIVSVRQLRVRAVGTAFSVRRRSGGADVLVTEGKVQTWTEGNKDHLVNASAGTRISLDGNSRISAMPANADAIDRSLAWRSGKIDLFGETLADAATEFNRYNVKKLVVDDPTLGKQRFYGVFRTNDPQGFANAVHYSMNARIAVDGQGNIRISAGQ